MVDNAQLVEAADRWGTPLYVTDLDAALVNAVPGGPRCPRRWSPTR